MEYDVKQISTGSIVYCKKGTKIYHREDGPAIEFINGDKVWLLNGDYHRIDGPAVEDMDGYKEWWVDGKRLSPEREFILNRWWNNKNGI